MGRTILGMLAGIVTAWITIMLCEFTSVALYPPPPGLDLRDPVALAAHVAAAPATAMACVLAGWVLGSLIGGWVAAKIAHHPRAAALGVGIVVVAGVIANSMMIPHPLWMTIAGLLLPIPAALLATRWARRRDAAAPR